MSFMKAVYVKEGHKFLYKTYQTKEALKKDEPSRIFYFDKKKEVDLQGTRHFLLTRD